MVMLFTEMYKLTLTNKITKSKKEFNCVMN